MLNIRELSTATGLTVRQSYARLSTLSQYFPESVVTGKRGALLVGDRGLTLIRRLVELEKDGLTAEAACEKIQEELGTAVNNGKTDTGKDSAISPHNGENDNKLYSEMRERIAALEQDKEYLKEQNKHLVTQLSTAHEEIRALMPGLKQEQQRMSRWQAFRIALLGR